MQCCAYSLGKREEYRSRDDFDKELPFSLFKMCQTLPSIFFGGSFSEHNVMHVCYVKWGKIRRCRS